ncbi:ATP-binding protein [Kribbella sp. NPDC058245]|uniref:ATP-binding protein n=1 Tax=Kribbella sp. NPDC058245 TaxID=3346399 RepID=UPI0036EC15E5
MTADRQRGELDVEVRVEVQIGMDGYDEVIVVRPAGVLSIATVFDLGEVQPAADADRRLAIQRLPYDVRSARISRRHVVRVCTDWGCLGLLDRALTVSDELISNGLRHSEGELIHRLEFRDGLLVIAVTDGSPVLPVLRPLVPGELRTNGYGLQLVAAQSASWGSAPTAAGGKVVWAVLCR